jgi:hypothetical protein
MSFFADEDRALAETTTSAPNPRFRVSKKKKILYSGLLWFKWYAFIQFTTTVAPVRLPEEVVAVADHLMSQVAQLQQEGQVELPQPPVRPAQVRLTYFVISLLVDWPIYRV